MTCPGTITSYPKTFPVVPVPASAREPLAATGLLLPPWSRFTQNVTEAESPRTEALQVGFRHLVIAARSPPCLFVAETPFLSGILWMAPSWSVCSLTKSHPACFHVSTITDKAAVNISLHFFKPSYLPVKLHFHPHGSTYSL